MGSSSEAMDPEAKAINAVARALTAVPADSQRRIVGWMGERFPAKAGAGDDLHYLRLVTAALKEVNAWRDAAKVFIVKCPTCKGSGALAKDASGFNPRCGACGPFRDLLANPPISLPDADRSSSGE